MAATLGLASAIENSILNLFYLHEISFPSQTIDWDAVLEKVIAASNQEDPARVHGMTFQTLVHASIGRRVIAIGSKFLFGMVDEKLKLLGNIPMGIQPRREYISAVKALVVKCEEEYSKLKEATSMIELVLWKIRMNDCFSEQKYETRRFKKLKLDKPDVRNRCRVTCGAGTVIEHVLPYLLPKPKRSDE